MFFLTRAGRPQPPKWNSDWCFQLFLHTIHGYGKLKKLNHPNVSFQLVQTFSGWWFEPTPLKNDGVRQIGSSSQLGKKQVMFQTTKQFSMLDHPSEKDDGSQDGHL